MSFVDHGLITARAYHDLLLLCKVLHLHLHGPFPLLSWELLDLTLELKKNSVGKISSLSDTSSDTIP